jgi:hypothetical protein
VAHSFEEIAMDAWSPTRRYELRFRSLFNEGRGFAFPCDAAGHVDLDALGERLLNNYLYARSMIGRELATPAVQPVWCH